MITFHKNEQILLILHRHWFIFALQAAAVFAVGLFPFFLFPILPIEAILFLFFAVIFWLLLAAFLLIAWIEYWLDMWIITSERIIDIEQRSLFSREISEFLLSRVQDVTVEVPNFIATMMRYGNIVVQTAGEKSFTIREIPHLEKAKEIILEQCRKINERNPS